MDGKHRLFHREQIDPFSGDLLDLSYQILGLLDAVYGQAALVALLKAMWVQHCPSQNPYGIGAPTRPAYEYYQAMVPEPPSPLPPDELHRHSSDSYALTPLVRLHLPGGLKGKCPAIEHA